MLLHSVNSIQLPVERVLSQEGLATTDGLDLLSHRITLNSILALVGTLMAACLTSLGGLHLAIKVRILVLALTWGSKVEMRTHFVIMAMRPRYPVVLGALAPHLANLVDVLGPLQTSKVNLDYRLLRPRLRANKAMEGTWVTKCTASKGRSMELVQEVWAHTINTEAKIIRQAGTVAMEPAMVRALMATATVEGGMLRITGSTNEFTYNYLQSMEIGGMPSSLCGCSILLSRAKWKAVEHRAASASV